MSLSSKITAVAAGLHDNEETDNKKQKNECGQEEVKKRAPVTSNMKPPVNNEKPDEYYYEIEAEEQKRWKLESEREARLEAARKRREEHWLELEAIRITKEEYEEDHVVEEKYDQEDDEDNEIENYDYDDLHLAYSSDKSPKL
ncbi:hypothetical protein Tco_0247103 [Tanacetum coccineum]